MARKTPKPKMQSYIRIDPKVDTLGVYPVLEDCLKRFRPDLVAEQCRVALVFRHGLKRNRDGQLVLGKCKKVGALDQEFEAFDFIIILNQEAWKTLSAEQRTALMHHELCHAAIAEDPNGNTKKDARNRTCFRVRKHDIEEFGEVINHHGCYKQDLENFVATAMRSKKPPAPTLLDGILEPSSNGAVNIPEPSANGVHQHDHDAQTIPMASAARTTPKRPAPKPRGKARAK